MIRPRNRAESDTSTMFRQQIAPKCTIYTMVLVSLFFTTAVSFQCNFPIGSKSRRVHTSRDRVRRNLSFSWHDDRRLPTVEFIDPATNCQVILLGCFHGTVSSSKDVEDLVTSESSVVALELCTSRFSDLKRELLKTEDEQLRSQEKPWLGAYWEMVAKTAGQRGLPTGIAAAILGGFSGIQTALSGFTPGLEFITALKRSESYGCDIVLADQDVDETLRRVGSLPQISLNNFLSNDRFRRWSLHHDTLVRAVVGKYDDDEVPQVQLPMVLLRNPDAIKDLIRLTIPPTLFFWSVLYGIAAIAGIDLSSSASQAYSDTATLAEKIPHWLASGGIIGLGYLGLALPAVGVILTERDEILTAGIKAACKRAGQGGQVVAVLGLLHVNGVAKRMLSQSVQNTDPKECA